MNSELCSCIEVASSLCKLSTPVCIEMLNDTAIDVNIVNLLYGSARYSGKCGLLRNILL